MKTKRYLGFARTWMLLLAAGALFSACQSESVPSDNDGDSVLMTLQAGPSGTRTTNDGDHTFWSEGDALSVIHSAAGGQTFYSSRFDFLNGNQFQGPVKRLSASNDWYAVYPYSEENVAANQIHLTFPAQQTQTGNGNKKHFAGTGFPLFGIQKGVARSANLSVSMQNLLSAAEFHVTNSTSSSLVVKEIVFTAPSAIVGNFQVNLASEDVVFTAETGAAKTVTLTVNEGAAIAPSGSATFYAAFAPFDVPAGGSLEYKVVAEDASGKKVAYPYSLPLASGTSFHSGQFKTVNIALDDAHAQSAGLTFYLTTELTDGEQYLIVSGGKALTNDGTSTPAATTVTPANDQIEVDEADAEAMVWKAAASSSGFTLSNGGKYIQRGSGSSGKPSIGSAPSSTNYYLWTYDGSRLTTASGTAYSLYYSSNAWAQSSSSSAGTATIYSANKPLTPQTISFDAPSVSWTVGEGGDHVLNQSYALPLQVKNAQTTVTYTSENTNVATISGTMVTIKKTGSAVIVATAKSENGYKEATASFTLYVREKISGEFVDLGVFNLENDKVNEYLDRAYSEYTDETNTTFVSSYSSGASSTNRLDIPKPVTISWGTACSGTATTTIYADQAMEEIVWIQTASSGSTSDKVYNLVPGKTYYCTVEDDSGALLKGAFTTEGRRRMMQVSTSASSSRANNCRDLGGMKTIDGKKRIKYGMIYRGTNLDGTSNKSISNYVSPNNYEQGLLANYMNVGYDIDLRAGGSSAFESKYSVVYVLGNMQPNVSDCMKKANAQPTMQGFIDAAKAGKASYFHCAIGSDRTGFWGLLIEGILGVSVKECSIDYELTSFARNVTSGDRTRNSGLFSDGLKEFNKRTGNTLQEQINDYLVNELDISQSDIDAFKSIVLEDVE